MEYWGKTTLFYKSRRKREVRRSLVDVLNTSLWSAEQWRRAEWAAGDQTRPENVDRVCNKHVPKVSPRTGPLTALLLLLPQKWDAEYQKGGCEVVGRCHRAAWDRSFLHLRQEGGWTHQTNESFSSSSVLWVCLCVRFIYFLLTTYS